MKEHLTATLIRRPAPSLNGVCFFASLSILFASFVSATITASAGELLVHPSTVELDGPFARQQLVVTLDNKDVTDTAQLSSSDPTIVDLHSQAYLVAKKDGHASLQIAVGDQKVDVPVLIKNFHQNRPVDFKNDIEPIFTRYGCNAGGCHGKASGQNGFKLSLFGFDADTDYDEIVQRARGRRVMATSPDQSLLLEKSVAKMPHGGGKRFDENSEPYSIIRSWIATGTPRYSLDAPTVTSLSVFPDQKVMKPQMKQQIAVTAHYSDGSKRDVTRLATMLSNLDVVAKVNDKGLVETLTQSGEAAVMAQYMGQVAVFRAIVPHGEPRHEIPDFTPNNYVDQFVVEKWKKLGLLPSPLADDATFLRRVTLDICGRIPTVEEVNTFLADNSNDKRSRVIDRLLDSPDYAAFFALRWSVILRNSQLAGSTQASIAFHNWIRNSIAQNEPYDQFVRGIVACAGEWQDAPAVNWLWQNRDDQLHQTTADVAQIFLGTRLQCARCHHHPYEKWGQEDYYGLAGFFTRLGRKSFGEPPPYFSSPSVTLSDINPVTGKQTEPKYLAGKYVSFAAEEDPRHGLVDWMVQQDNPFFAKALVNRMWGHFLGRGIVHAVDDLRDSNPPSNPELLHALTYDFASHHFDVKHLIRTIVNSRTYQLSSDPREENKNDSQNYARFYARRHIAEVFLDAVDQATGTKTKFGGIAESARAIELPHEGFSSPFLDAFDRPKRVTVCECERSSSTTLAQVLLLSNSDEIENKIASDQGRVQKLINAKISTESMVEELYLAALSRKPTPHELKVNVDYINAASNKSEAIQDSLWSIMNSREFVFNH